MPLRTDTERLDWVIDAFIGGNEEKTAAFAGAMLMGKDGREAIDFAMDGSVPAGVAAAAMSLRGAA